MIHEPPDINDPCCDECVAWYTGEPTITEFLEYRIAEDEAAARADSDEMARSSVSIQFDCDTQARFTPARVLAECKAKRAVIRWWTEGLIGYVRVDGELTNPLLPLATVYADHPDYQQEWGANV